MADTLCPVCRWWYDVDEGHKCPGSEREQHQRALADRDRRIEALTKALREARAAVFEESAHIAETCYEERCCNEPVPRCCGRGRNGECCGDPEPECCGQPERIPYSPDDIAKALRDAKEAALASAAGAEGKANV